MMDHEAVVDEPLEAATVSRPPYAFCRRFGLMVTEVDNQLIVSHRADVKANAWLEIQRFLSRPFKQQPVSDGEFDRLMAQTYETGTDQAAQMMEDLGDELDLLRAADALPQTQDLLESQDDAPIIRLINAMLTEAVKSNASDIHVESFEQRMVVRFREDGILREVLTPNPSLAPLIVSRIKVMAHLDIAEKRLPQDGRIALRVAGRAVDVRVSTVPSSHGERIVLRLLDKQAGRLDLSSLGMSREALASMERIIHRPHGIVLVTGPTGSGKTTTLYASISGLNDATRNIMTVEDPIEYDLDGIAQTQVNTKVNMTFARGLRAMLRQDPDVVMVGEIRDIETARVAIQASLTGHMVFSTIHTNTAVGAVTRLQDIGVEPYLLSSSIEGIVAQRLVRRLCPDCKKPEPNAEEELARLGRTLSDTPTLYRPVGCERCHYKGYAGRMGIYEVIEIDEHVRSMIHDGASEQALERYTQDKFITIHQDGLSRIMSGETSIDEVLRVTTLS